MNNTNEKVNDDEVDEMETLLQRHRKEKKELQNKLQALKKSASKGDKKKKKEVTEEMTRLETEMKDKHEKEMTEVKLKIPNEPPKEVEANEGEPITRISKAQKRREKKENQLKQRELRILEQEMDNLQGPRHLETEEIKSILKKRDLMISQIPSDGDCMYNAIIKRIQELGGICPTMKELRFQTAEFLRQNPSEFLPYLCHPETGDMLNQVQYAEYCDEVERKAWGGQVELRALSHILKRPLEVIQAKSPPVVVGEEYMKAKSDIISIIYHRHMYGLGKHYNAVAKFKEELESEESS